MSNHRRVVNAPGAPDAVGPYSHAVAAGGLLFCSGQVALDPGSGELLDGPTADQAVRCLKNLEEVCTAGGSSLAHAVRLTVYLTDLGGDWAAVNGVYAAFFDELGAEPPARLAIGAAALPKGASVEIEAVVALPD